MINYVACDLFTSPARVLVNTVNTVGVMGENCETPNEAVSAGFGRPKITINVIDDLAEFEGFERVESARYRRSRRPEKRRQKVRNVGRGNRGIILRACLQSLQD